MSRDFRKLGYLESWIFQLKNLFLRKINYRKQLCCYLWQSFSKFQDFIFGCFQCCLVSKTHQLIYFNFLKSHLSLLNP